jgi:CHASE3 domain sensor protein
MKLPTMKLPAMKLPLKVPFKIVAPGASLRRRVAVSLAIVRLILAPVILLAIYYLFLMGWIVDRIVSVDAPAATLAQQASIQMLDARRAERNYFLLHDPSYIEANRASLASVALVLGSIRDLEPGERPAIQNALDDVKLYHDQFATAVSRMEHSDQTQVDRVEAVVRAYERDLNALLARDSRQRRAQLVEDLRNRVGSFDTEISDTVQAGDPTLGQVTAGLQTSGAAVMDRTTDLEARAWQRVEKDHSEAHRLLRRAEWVLGIVSACTILLSIWVGIMLPRQVVKPLLALKEAVDHAAAGNYEIEFDMKGQGEVIELAGSIRNLIAHIREKVSGAA